MWMKTALLSLLFPGLLLAQNEVRGRIYPAPGETSLPPDITVTLEFPMEAFEETTYVNQKGEFRFGVSAGEFVDAYVTLKSPGYQTKRIHFDSFDRFPRYLTVTLGPRLPSEGDLNPGGGVVGASELAVPREAIRKLSEAAEKAGKGDYKKALKLIDQSEKIAPDFVEVYASRAVVLMKMKQLKKAEEVLKKAIELDANHFSAQKNLGYLYLITKREPEAVAPLQKAIEINSSDASSLGFLGEALYQTGKYDDAVEPLKKALKLNPEFFRASYRLGYVYIQLKQYPEALAAFEQFLKTNQGMPDTRVRDLVVQLKAALNP